MTCPGFGSGCPNPSRNSYCQYTTCIEELVCSMHPAGLGDCECRRHCCAVLFSLVCCGLWGTCVLSHHKERSNFCGTTVLWTGHISAASYGGVCSFPLHQAMRGASSAQNRGDVNSSIFWFPRVNSAPLSLHP